MINNSNYTTSQIETVLNFRDRTRYIDFRFDLLSRNDIKIGTLTMIEQASVEYDEFSAIKRTGSFTLDERDAKQINFLSDHIQPWFVLNMPDEIAGQLRVKHGASVAYRNDGGTVEGRVEWPLGIYLLESPRREISGIVKRRNIGAYDKGLILEQYRLPYRQYFPAGTNYVAAVERLLAMAGIVKVNIPPSDYELPADIEYPMGTNSREAINGLLEAAGYNSVGFDEYGVAVAAPYVFPARRPISKSYSSIHNSIVRPALADDLDIASVPNVFIRAAENLETSAPMISRFVNDDAKSSTSTINRGREITDFASLRDIASQEVLDTLVRRVAIEATQSYRHLEFTTPLMPHHGASETLYIDFPELFETPQKFIETYWSMDLRAGGDMRHKARVAVDL